MSQSRRRQFLISSSALLTLGLAYILLHPAAAAELSWTPCHRLEMGGRLQEICQACTAKGTGWRFYVSRDGTLTQCNRDPGATSIYRQPWAENEAPERREIEPARPAPRAETRPREKSGAHAPASPHAAKPPSSSKAPSSGTSTASPKRSDLTRESHGTAPSPASQAAKPPARTAEHKHPSSPPPQPARQQAERKGESKKPTP